MDPNTSWKLVIGGKRGVLSLLWLLSRLAFPVQLGGSYTQSFERWFARFCFSAPFKIGILKGAENSGIQVSSQQECYSCPLCVRLLEILILLPWFISLLNVITSNLLHIYCLILLIRCLLSLECELHEGRGTCLFCSLLCLPYLANPWATPLYQPPTYTYSLLHWVWFYQRELIAVAGIRHLSSGDRNSTECRWLSYISTCEALERCVIQNKSLAMSRPPIVPLWLCLLEPCVLLLKGIHILFSIESYNKWG